MSVIKRTWPYGTTKVVRVEQATRRMIMVADKREAFCLVNHGLEFLPAVGSKGIIVFTEGGPMGGYWKFSTVN